jgi:hypothetical protein
MAKYVKTIHGEIIVFPETMKHSEFSHLKPVSAGFIKFFSNGDDNCKCICSGMSLTLDLKADKEDSRIAQNQLVRLF